MSMSLLDRAEPETRTDTATNTASTTATAAQRLRTMSNDVLPLMALRPAIHRDVTPSGVRVYSLCGSCGTRLETSATLCEDCAQRRSRLT